MKTLDAVFSLELSPAELHWLAGAFAITRLPLPEDPSRFLTASAWKMQLVHAPVALQERGFLAGSPDSGWQVDRLPGAIVRWLGSARSMLRLDVHIPDGTRRCVYLFSENNTSMQVMLTENTYKFVLFSDPIEMINHVMDWLGAARVERGDDMTTGGFPQPLVILAAAWKDPALASKMLKVAGLKPDEIKSILFWLLTLEWSATLKRIQLDVEDAGTPDQIVLWGNRQKAWAGTTGRSTNDPVTYSRIDLEGIRDTIRRLL